MIRKTLIAVSVAASSLAGMGSIAQATPAIVYTGPAFVGQTAPPPPLYEAVPVPRAGQFWTPGHYEWRGDRYVWTTGRWQETRPGWGWQEARWQQRSDGSWYLVGGQWVRRDNIASYDDRDRYGRRVNGSRGPDGDLDGDGIANRDDRDIDGDGVRNRDDDFPRDPTRN